MSCDLRLERRRELEKKKGTVENLTAKCLDASLCLEFRNLCLG